MSNKLEIKGNTFYITDTVTGVEWKLPSTDVRYEDNKDNSITYYDSFDVKANIPIGFSTIIDFENNPFVDFQALTDWNDSNLGVATPIDQSAVKKTGFIDYNDTATTATPISVTGGGGAEYLTNDGLGAFTNKLYPPTGITDVYDTTADQFDFSELTLGSKLHYRVDVDLTISGSNASVELQVELAIGGSAYTLDVGRQFFKTSGTYNMTMSSWFYMGDSNTIDNGAKFKINSTNDLDIKVNGWACHISIY